MSKAEATVSQSPPGKLVWVGRIITGLMGALFVMSAIGKFTGGEQAVEGFKHLGIPAEYRIGLGVLELTCAVLYLIPATATLGAILLTGYMGGAICSHLRVGDPFVVQSVFGVLIWVGLYLRERRLWSLLPIRRASR